MNSSVEIKSYDTEAALYVSLARVFGEEEHGGTRWVALTVDGVKITFFGPREAAEVAA